MAQLNVVTFDNLKLYDELLKDYISEKDARALKTVAIEGNTLKFYREDEPVGESTPAYTIELPEADISTVIPLITGATAGNVVIAKADGTVEDGNVALADLATKTEVEAVDEKADANADAIAAINNTETGILKQANDYADGKDTAIQAAQDAVDALAQTHAEDKAALVEKDEALQDEIDAIENELGDVENLSTTNKTVAGAINEVLAAVGTGGTASVVTVTTDTTTEGALKSYTIKQGTTTVGVIDIPKDMVVESGEVITNPEGQAEGTYIKLVLANVAEPLYINVGTLVDIYKAQANATQIQLTIDSSTREISATIVAGSVTATELADNAITTVKIADANVTLAKLAASVQASLAKADAAAPQTKLDEEVQARKDADAGLDERLQVVEGKAHEHTNEAVLNGITAEKVSAWDSAESNAKGYADGLNTAMDTRVSATETAVSETLPTSIADAKKAGDDAAAAVTALETGKVAENAEAIEALQGLVGEGYTEIPEADIRGLFD